jgi:predicted flavoprotein YhiN
MPQPKSRVVILGAGFGGLEAAKTLRRAPVEITLIDRQNYHCFSAATLPGRNRCAVSRRCCLANSSYFAPTGKRDGIYGRGDRH